VTSLPDAQPAAVSRPPLSERLPKGNRAILAAGVGVFLVAASFIRFGLSAHALLGAFLVSVLTLLAAIDLEHRVLPNAIVLPSVLVALALAALWQPHKVPMHLLAGAAFGGFLLIVSLVYPRGLGMGDAKLALVIGLALGSATIGAVVVSSVALWLGALVVIVRGGLSARKQTIPFGPYLAIGAIVAFFFS
jgi:prepilin signal peptidase PulO-like enzyme (type II secretory pathway)